MSFIEAIFYEKTDGTEPAKVFLLSLDIKMRAKMMRTITLLEDNGTRLREPHSKALGDGLFELRAKIGSNISRIIYFYVHGKKAILTNGFVKKSNETPPSETDLARSYRTDYLARSKNND